MLILFMETNNIDQNKPEIDSFLNSPKVNKLIPLNLIIGIVIGIILTTSVASAVYFYKKASNLKSVDNSKNSSYLSPTETQTEISPVQQGQFGTITWLDEPEKITLPSILKSISFDDEYTSFSEEIYQVASFSDGSKLFDISIHFGGPDYSLVRLVESKGQYFYLIENLDKNTKDTLSNQAIIKPVDLGINYFFIPTTIVANGLNLVKTYETNYFISNYANPQKIADTEFGRVYQVNEVPQAHIGFSTKQFLLRLKDNSVVLYKLSKQPNLDRTFFSSITWNDGNKNTFSFNQNIVSTCSLGGVGVPYTDKTSFDYLQKRIIGKTNDGQSLYQITNSNDPVVQYLYKNYKDSRSYPGSPAVISLDEFVNKINHFLLQDEQGDWQLFINNDYGSAAECGKPVIYLYPQKETKINVQVGAKISQSEPLYPQGGWNVLAKPNGELIYQNQSYPYLFWEGLGIGDYPNYRNKGFVVSQKDLINTVYKHLSQLGLNQKESNDFMEFWQPKLPKTPYVRLTWFDTADMDKLAPLGVNPKPDTKIRIFLEFEGLEKPVNLIPQTLSAPKRTGFTLIEWGGLLLK